MTEEVERENTVLHSEFNPNQSEFLTFHHLLMTETDKFTELCAELCSKEALLQEKSMGYEEGENLDNLL